MLKPQQAPGGKVDGFFVRWLPFPAKDKGMDGVDRTKREKIGACTNPRGRKNIARKAKRSLHLAARGGRTWGPDP